MKYVRFSKGAIIGFGILEQDVVRCLDGDFLQHANLTGETFSIEEVRLLAPVCGGKIIAAGLNYKSHVSELSQCATLDFPTFFVKLPHTVIGQHDAILYPEVSSRVDYEAELAIVIGQDCYHASEAEAGFAIFGYTCLNDVTARDLQQKDGQWTRCKNFESFCPIGPCVETDIDENGLNITTTVNGSVVQRGNTRDMIFPPIRLVQLISEVIPLKRGDVVSTGTPGGIGPMVAGDVVEVFIEGIGKLRNIVVKR